MSDIAYRLLVDMSAKGSLGPQLGQMQAQAKGLDTSLQGLGGSLKQGFQAGLSSVTGTLESIGDKLVDLTVSAAKIGAVGLVGAAAYGVKLNDELEKTQVGLAAIFKAQGVSSNMTDGLELATAAMEKMRIHARDLPGELKDLQLIFRLGMTPGLQLGASVGQLERISANAMAAAATSNMPMDQAARELAQLYNGHAGGHNVFGQMLGFSGEAAKKLNAAQGGERLKLIEDALGKYKDSIPVFAKTFDALTSTLKDNADQTLKRATKPLFDAMKGQLDRANKWFGDNEEKVGHWADNVGRRLEQAFEAGRRKVEEWTPAVQTFAQNASAELAHIWQVAKPFVERLEKGGISFLSDPNSMKSIEHAAMLYGGLKATRALSPIISPMLGGLGDALGGTLGLTGAGASIASLGATAAVAAPAILLLVGTLSALTDKSSEYHASVTQHVRDLGREAESIGKHLSNVGERIGPWAAHPFEAASNLWLGQLEMQVSWLEKAAKGLDVFTGSLKSLLDKVGVTAPTMTTDAPDPLDRSAENAALTESLNPIKAMGQIIKDLDLDAQKTKKGAGGGGGGTTIQKVEIVITTNQDPTRIARLVEDRMISISRNPTSSPHAYNPASRR